MLVEAPPPPPFPEAVWVGGYWVWQGNWVWAHGHWVAPPRPAYVWVHPYYEHRDGVVIFITGHWSPPGAAFVPPPPGLHLTVEVALPGVVPGPRPIGPDGCFVPPPPGSRPGFIVPAPIGTPPAVVTGAPPVVAVGMRISNTVTNNTTINNRTTSVTNITNVTNVTNVTIVAPPGAVAGGKAFNSQVPAQAHLAAAQPAVFQQMAPEPASAKPIPSYRPGSKPMLPPVQAVNTSGAPADPAAAQNEHGPGSAGPRPEMRKQERPNNGGGAQHPNAAPPDKPAVAQNGAPQNNGAPRNGNGPGAHPNGANLAMKHEEVAHNPPAAQKKPPAVAANKGAAKGQEKDNKKPNGNPNAKKDSKNEKKEHEAAAK
jgi:hypothetical protein